MKSHSPTKPSPTRLRFVFLEILCVWICTQIGFAQVPQITTQPQDATNFIGSASSTQLSISASGPALTYNWYEGQTGDINRLLKTSSENYINVSPTATTTYWVRVRNSFGSVDSRTVTVTMVLPDLPKITTQPKDATNYVGSTSSTTLSVSALGQFLAYKWYEGQSGDTNKPISNSNSPNQSVRPAVTSVYWVRVSNAAGSADSRTVTVTMLLPDLPKISTEPKDATNYVGSTSSALLTVSASGQVLSYKWYEGQSGDTNKPIANSNSPNQSVRPAVTTDYWVRVSNAAGFADSRTVTVTMLLPDLPKITRQPNDTTNIARLSVSLSVEASSHVLNFRWYRGQSGDTNSPLNSSDNRVVSVSPTNSTQYWVRVSNAAGQVDSRTVAVTVVPLLDALKIEWASDFGKVEAGTTAKRKLKISTRWAVGYDWIEMGNIRVPAGFSAPSFGWRSIGIDASDFEISFSPTEKKRYEGELVLTFNKPTEAVSLAVSGEGADPSRLVQMTGSLDFNTVQIGRSARRNLTLRNVGASPIPLRGLSIPSGFQAQLSTTNLAWGAELILDVTFSPSEARDYSDSLQVLAELSGGAALTLLRGKRITASGIVTVPNDQLTINLGIDAAGSGDIVRVFPGVYRENVVIRDKGIRLRSLYDETGDTRHISSTIIDGSAQGNTVFIEEATASVSGFTITNGLWGILCYAFTYDSSSFLSGTISDNLITGNSSGGVNLQTAASLPFFGRFSAAANISAIIRGNTIVKNNGPALKAYGAGTADIGYRYGNVSCDFLQNVVAHNQSALHADSVDYRSLGDVDVRIASSTFYQNGATPVYVHGTNSNIRMQNTIFWNESPYALDIGTGSGFDATFSLIGVEGNALPGLGNIFVNPQFKDHEAGDFSLKSTSPCVDAGALILPGRMDFFGVFPDMGAIEPISIEPRVAVRRFNSQLEVYFNGILQSAAKATGPFTDVTNAQNPLMAPKTEPSRFWRARKN